MKRRRCTSTLPKTRAGDTLTSIPSRTTAPRSRSCPYTMRSVAWRPCMAAAERGTSLRGTKMRSPTSRKRGSSRSSPVIDASTALDWTADFARSRELVEEAEALAGAAAPEALRARIDLGKGRALWRADRRPEAVTTLEVAASLAERVGDAGYETLIISLVL